MDLKQIAGVAPDALGPGHKAVLAASFPQTTRRERAPQVLSTDEAGHYAAIFALQDQGLWRSADAHIALIHDRVLLGTVLAQRYLSAAYHPSFAELRAWMVSYADHPDARAIWTAARHLAPRRQTLPKPKAVKASLAASDDALPTPHIGSLSPPRRFDASLNAWRDGRFSEAARGFERVAQDPETGSWYVAAGAFWAARSHEALHDTQEHVDQWLDIAAQQPRTFYGLLARRLLSADTTLRATSTQLSPHEIALLNSSSSGRRALSLVELGETDRAEAELRALSGHAGRGLANAVVALADIANMPALCLKLSPAVSDVGRRGDALYPVPHWQPRNGYSVDRSLMFALMLQESAFDKGAASSSGASGLMQLMPQTARNVAHSAGIPLHRASELVDPEINLSLGQEYVKQLIKHDQINGNLILILAAYKGGPGSLPSSEEKSDYNGDPLLFLESLPRAETRLYVERVLTNMWIYRQRLGQNAPDLEALASNQWPIYQSYNRKQHRGYQLTR